MKRMLIIPADDSKPFSIFHLKPHGNLEALQAGVGGDIENVPHPHENDLTIYCNADGRDLNKPHNTRATLLWRQLYNADFPDDLVGDIIVLGGVDNNGDEKDLPESILDAMKAI